MSLEIFGYFFPPLPLLLLLSSLPPLSHHHHRHPHPRFIIVNASPRICSPGFSSPRAAAAGGKKGGLHHSVTNPVFPSPLSPSPAERGWGGPGEGGQGQWKIFVVFFLSRVGLEDAQVTVSKKKYPHPLDSLRRSRCVDQFLGLSRT